MPPWLSQKIPEGEDFFRISEYIAAEKIHTVCQEAKCPNRTECWARGTLTFQILGDVCTRACGFCAEKRGRPDFRDPHEPARVVQAAKALGLRHVVITAPARDDMPDGGSQQFAATIRELRSALPNTTVEVLVPDFQENARSLQTVFDARPDVFNHNIETVRRLTPRVRSRATYERSLRVLKKAGEAGLKTKSGLMVGLGETREEIDRTLQDLRQARVRLLTIGQYLPPSNKHLPLDRYYTPQEFEDIRRDALALGFEQAASGPLVRSSYHADEMITS